MRRAQPAEGPEGADFGAETAELPEKYTHGLQTTTSAGLGTVATLAEALEAFLGVD